jgi:hypothetical protein
MKTYQDLINQTRSRKHVLAIIRSKCELKVFSLVSGTTYEKEVPFFVESMTFNGVNKTFTYDIQTKKITFTSATSPENFQVIVTYKHFFSNSSLVLPHNLALGVAEVEYDSRLIDIGELKLELDYENTGIALESNSSITLENSDGFFDDVFDTHIWENQNVEFYYHFEELPLTDTKLIYKGVIENKSFNPKQIKFSIKDRFYSLRNALNLNTFSALDGSLDEAHYEKPKRRIYGEVSKLRVNSISMQKGVIFGTGTVAGISGAAIVTGTGTTFLSEISPGDQLVIDSLGDSKEYSILSVDSDTQLTLSENITTSFTAIALKVKSDVPSRNYNRRWSIAGHKLYECNKAITVVNNSLSVDVSDASDFEVDDLVELNGSTYVIRTIKGNTIRVNQNISPTPIVSDILKKVPCFKAYYGINELVYNRDFTLENSTDHAVLVLDSKAEENITAPKLKSVTLSWTNGSRNITTSSGVDLKTIFKTRDMIKPSNVTYSNYYEVLEVQESQIKIRTIFSDATFTGTVLLKEMNWIEDDSVVCVDCIGLGTTKWIRYPADIVKHIINNDAGQTTNDASFADSVLDAKYKLSAFFPRNIGDSSPVIKDCITEINESVFGSLFYDSYYDFKFSILNSNKPESILEIKEDDVLSYESITKNNIINKGIIEHRDETNLITGEQFRSSITKGSDFVDRTSGIKQQKTIQSLVFSSDDADLLLQRFMFFNSLTNSIVKVKAKLNLSNLNLNDAVQITFDRIYRRYGGKNKTKIGLINLVSKNETTTTVQINDLSGLFNRVPSIAPDTLDNITVANESEIAKFGFVVDNNTNNPDGTDNYTGANLIG